MFIGVLLSLTLFIYKAAHPRVRRLRATDPLMRYAPDNMPEGLVVYVIEGTLFFGAIHELERQLYEEDDTPSGGPAPDPRVLAGCLRRPCP